ncbi:MAG: hypothetical protein ACK6DO_04205 [Planctomycetia bacterium]
MNHEFQQRALMTIGANDQLLHDRGKPFELRLGARLCLGELRQSDFEPRRAPGMGTHEHCLLAAVNGGSERRVPIAWNPDARAVA